MQMSAEDIREYLESKLKIVKHNKEDEHLTDITRAEYIGQEWLLDDILRSIK